MDKKIKRVNFYTIENIGNIQDITNFIYDKLDINDAFKIKKKFINFKKFNTLIQTYEYGKTYNRVAYKKYNFKYSFWTKYNNVHGKMMEYIKSKNDEEDINKPEIIKFKVYNNIKKINKRKNNQQNNIINTNITDNNNDNTIEVNNTENNSIDSTDYSVLTDIGGGVKLHIIRPNKKD